MKIGDKIKVPAERQRYTVRAFNERFVIMTKPMNALKTFLYVIVDLDRNVRGPDNMIFGAFCNYEKDAAAGLSALASGEMLEVSHRRHVTLEPEVRAQLVA